MVACHVTGARKSSWSKVQSIEGFLEDLVGNEAPTKQVSVWS